MTTEASKILFVSREKTSYKNAGQVVFTMHLVRQG